MLRHAFRDAVVALRVAPVEVALGVAVAVTWSIALAATPGSDMQAWLELATLCTLAGGFAWIATLLHGLGALAPARRWLLTLAGFAAVVVYDRTLLDFDRAAEGWRAFLLIAAVALAITLVPLLVRTPDGRRDRRFREVNLRMLTRAIGVVLYAGALYLGLVLAIAAVKSLFELNLNERIYGHVFGAIAFGLAPWIFVGGAPAITAPPGPPADGMRIVRRFGVYLFLPLLVIYYLILYAYLVRIAVTGELPRNLVSPLVLLAGIIGAIGVMMFAGTAEEGEEGAEGEDAAVPWAVRMAAPLFLPLAVLGFWAIAVRVRQYGWTEFRYLRTAALVALLLLAMLGTWALLRRRRLQAFPVSLVLGVIALLCALGPWSATATARRSQQARLAEALRMADVDTAAVPAAPRVVPAHEIDEIRSTGRYLNDHFGKEAVTAVVGHAAAAQSEGQRPGDLAAELGLEAPVTSRRGTARLADALPVDALGKGELYVVELPTRHGVPGPGTWGRDTTVLRLHLRDRTFTADLAGLANLVLADSHTTAATLPGRPGGRARAVPARAGPTALRLEDATLPIQDENGRNAGRFVVRWLVVQSDSAGVRVREVEGLAVVEPDVSR
ncbi:MAG: DUF4153 domain-containing protein [Gemmatimonadota bacterium]|jgi:hypothetical protein